MAVVVLFFNQVIHKPQNTTGSLTQLIIQTVVDQSLYSISIQLTPQKLCVGVKYYIVHMYSMPYYTYGSTANILFLGPTALI